MFENILVPLDGAALAERAISYAVALARATDGCISLLHAVPGATTPNRGQTELETGARLERLAELLRNQGVKVRTQTPTGDAAEAILAAAEPAQTDVIVMSTHGRGGLGRWLYGSVAEIVLRRAQVPIMLVSATCDRPWPIDRPLKILVPLDGSATSAAALELAHRLGSILRADAIFLRVVEHAPMPDIAFDPQHLRVERIASDVETARAREQLDELARAPHGTFRSVDTALDVGDPAARIAALARQEGVDLIVMATHGRTGLARLTMGSVTTATLHQVAVPVLLIRPSGLIEEGSEPGATDRSQSPTMASG